MISNMPATGTAAEEANSCSSRCRKPFAPASTPPLRTRCSSAPLSDFRNSSIPASSRKNCFENLHPAVKPPLLTASFPLFHYACRLAGELRLPGRGTITSGRSKRLG